MSFLGTGTGKTSNIKSEKRSKRFPTARRAQGLALTASEEGAAQAGQEAQGGIEGGHPHHIGEGEAQRPALGLPSLDCPRDHGGRDGDHGIDTGREAGEDPGAEKGGQSQEGAFGERAGKLRDLPELENREGIHGAHETRSGGAEEFPGEFPKPKRTCNFPSGP